MDHVTMLTEFKQAMEDIGVHHITSSPHYHQPNGLAEKYTKQTDKNPNFVLIYTGTPHLGMACNPKWSYYMQGKLDVTCQCHSIQDAGWEKLQVPHHKLGQ